MYQSVLIALLLTFFGIHGALAKDEAENNVAGKPATGEASLVSKDQPDAAASETLTANSAPADAAANGEDVRDAKRFFDESFGDFKEELEVAKEEGKEGILIMFEMDECPFCMRMKQTVLNRGKVQDFYKDKFRILAVDVEGDLEMTDFSGAKTTQKDFSLKQHRVRATPVFQFFDLEGNTVKNGRLSGTAKTPDEFLLLAHYILDKENENQSFFQYKRAKEKRAKEK